MPNDIILFESYPNYSGSSLELYKYLLRKGYYKKYCMMWAIDANDPKPAPFPSIPFFNTDDNFRKCVLSNTKVIIDSNRYINKVGSIYRIHVRHGCSFKRCTGYYSQIGAVDAIITTSNAMRQIDEQVWPSQCKGKFIITGLPSNDRLFHPANISSFITELTGHEHSYTKVIGWLPTYRQHRWGNKSINIKYPLGLPIITNKVDLNSINDYLCMHNVLLLIQMHHAQAKNYTQLGDYSNIKLITEQVKSKFHVTNGDILGHCDALITDYSAAYHEYLILGRPIALTIDDIKEYSKAVGFCYPYQEWIHGQYCTTVDQLIGFIDNVLRNPDILTAQQADSLKRIHTYIDDHSTQRVVNYLEENKVIFI